MSRDLSGTPNHQLGTSLPSTVGPDQHVKSEFAALNAGPSRPALPPPVPLKPKRPLAPIPVTPLDVDRIAFRSILFALFKVLNTDKKQSQLVKIYLDHYCRIIVTAVVSAMHIDRNNRCDVAEDLGVVSGNLKRNLRNCRLLTKHLNGLLRRFGPTVRTVYQQAIAQDLPAIEALIPTEQFARTRLLKPYSKIFSEGFTGECTCQPAKLLEAAGMTALMGNHSRAETFHKAVRDFHADMRQAKRDLEFRECLLATYLRTQRIACESIPLRAEFSESFLHPDEDDSFLRFLVNAYDQRRFTWLLALEANFSLVMAPREKPDLRSLERRDKHH